jgi:hypothetical protein
MLFSQRYFRALDQKTLEVEVSDAARRKLWGWLKANNASVYVKRDPNDNWVSNSSILEETEAELLLEHGWDQIPGAVVHKNSDYFSALRHLIYYGDGAYVFDAIELAGGWMEPAEREAFRLKINRVFELHGCPWRLSDGEFFKLDGDFVGARLDATAHDGLTANRFAGAAEEYAKARQYLGAGEAREAITFAEHSFESVMKGLTNLEHGNADKLIKELLGRGYFDDLPESVQPGFADQVLKALPFLRNKLGGHGQGPAVMSIPQTYGRLAVQLAAAFHNFLISKHLERSPPPPPSLPAPQGGFGDDVPF